MSESHYPFVQQMLGGFHGAHPCAPPFGRVAPGAESVNLIRTVTYDLLPGVKDCLKPGVSFEILDAVAFQISDKQAVEQLQKARQKLF